MKFLIITHTKHKKQNDSWFAYGPYVNEMRLWETYADEIHIVAPTSAAPPETIELPYQSKQICFYKVPAFSFVTFAEAVHSLFKIPGILITLFKAMRKADHIHLRCPGNMGLLGCVVQLFFPKKKKSAKYAGNWDPKAQQPLSYRFQKWVLNNTFLTKNMQVMVYGHWPNTTKNILPFFTATYGEAEKETLVKSFQPPYKALFVGGLTPGKNALYALQLVHQLKLQGIAIAMEIYGEGVQRKAVEEYIALHSLNNAVVLKGNQSAAVLKEAYKSAHFVLLPSQSEGWPKAVAEAMFWGCIPLSTPVSCVPEMLGQGERGVLLTQSLEKDTLHFIKLLSDTDALQQMSFAARQWSQQFTLEAFEEKIKQLIEG